MKGVEDALRRLEGVRNVGVDLQANIIRIEPDPRAELDLAAIPEAVRRAGFAPAEMSLRARGAYEGDGPRFRIKGWRQGVPVAVVGPSPPTGEVTIAARVDYSGKRLLLRPTGAGE